jgi:hypothetical protein
MTDDVTDQEALELLRRLGRVDPPAAAVLAAARHPLWAAITNELLAGDAGPAQVHEAQQPAPRRQPRQASPEDRDRRLPPASS